MESNLRPLTLGEILDRTAQLYRANFLVFAGIFSVYSGVALLLNLAQIGLGALLHAGQRGARPNWVLISTGAAEGVLVVLLLGAAVAAINRAVGWVHLGGQATMRSAYASTLPRFGRYLWLMTITAVVAWLPLAILYSGYFGFVLFYVRPKGLLSHPTPAANPQQTVVFGLISIAFFLLILPASAYGVVMSLRYALAVPACVLENLTARRAIRRSVELSKGSRGRIFVLFLLVGVIKLGLVGITQTFFLAAVFKNHGQISPWMSAASQVVAFFTNTFIGPIGATGVALFYYDQRVRKEGYDIEWMMQTAGLTAAVAGTYDRDERAPDTGTGMPAAAETATQQPQANSDTTPAEPDAGTAERPLGTVQERPVRLTENA